MSARSKLLVKMALENRKDYSDDEPNEPFSDDSGSDFVVDMEDISSSSSEESSNETNENTTITSTEWGPISNSHEILWEKEDNIIISMGEIDYSKPVEIFRQFICNEILELIVLETNRFAAQKNYNKWVQLTSNELDNFFSITIVMGLVSLPSINMYWSKSEMFHNKFICNIMSRDRYYDILRFIHFNNNENDSGITRLHKIQPLSEKLLKNFQLAISPGRDLAIDESMIHSAEGLNSDNIYQIRRIHME